MSKNTIGGVVVGLALMVLATACGIETGTGSEEPTPAQDAERLEAFTSYYPALVGLSGAQLEARLGASLDELAQDPEAMAEALVASGSNHSTVGVDTTVSLQASTIRVMRAAWITSILAPFARIRQSLEQGRLDDVEAVPGIEFTVREVASAVECRGTLSPWLRVTREDIAPPPVRDNNDSDDRYGERVATWLDTVAANEADVLSQLDAWVRGVPRHMGTSDPLCFLDEEHARQLNAGVERPEVTLVTDYLVTGDTDTDVTDLEGLAVNLVLLCDIAGSEDARQCDNTRVDARAQLEEDLHAAVTLIDPDGLTAAVQSGDKPDRALVVPQLEGLDDAVDDLLTTPTHNDAF